MSKTKSASDAAKKSLGQARSRTTESKMISADSYSGKITTAGTSEAFRFDKSLFKQHPEFKQKAEVRADIIGPGTILVSLIDNPELENKDDPVVSAFLAFLEKDMKTNPKLITPVSAEKIARAKALTAHVTVSDDELE